MNDRLNVLLEKLKDRARTIGVKDVEQSGFLWSCGIDLVQATKPRWISVSSFEQPPLETIVYVWNGKNIHRALRRKGYDVWFPVCGHFYLTGITHWMLIELPEPPKS